MPNKSDVLDLIDAVNEATEKLAALDSLLCQSRDGIDVGAVHGLGCIIAGIRRELVGAVPQGVARE